MIMQRSGEERLKMGCSMNASSRELIRASLAGKDPAAVKKALFLRFYGDEFAPQERKNILLALKAAERKRVKAIEDAASKRKGRKPRPDPMDLAMVKSPGSGAVRDAAQRYGPKRKKTKQSRRKRTRSGD
jgi:hypothetical protein